MAVIQGDLHTHTTASDGMDSPADVVRQAAASGLGAVAITDHDTMKGVQEALREGERIGIVVIPGVELSTAWQGRDIHVLGYGPRQDHGQWQERLAAQGRVRERRNEMLLDRLAELGITLTIDEVLAAAGSGEDGPASLGRPHFAAAMVAAGAVASVLEAFDRYLAAGAPAYVSLPRITPEEGIRWIVDAGGIPVLAHPGLYGDDALVERLAASGGLVGIEVHHPDHTEADELRYAGIAARYGLLMTGGSDYHGRREGELYHGDIGSRTADAGALLDLLNR